MIIGASFSGLAVAACLSRAKVDYVLIEKGDGVGAPWRHHYDRLHLHTNKRLSGLPYFPWPASAPRYPSRLEVIAYLEEYARAFAIRPSFHTEALSVRRISDEWVTETNTGNIRSRDVVMATGIFGRPKVVALPGQESFPGRVVHSFGYKTGAAFTGQRVLVLGFGNSAGEIAIDLVEQGASVSMAVRSAVNVIPKEILGVPVVELSLLLRWLPPRVADAIAWPLVRGVVGDITRLGLRRKPYGPIEQIVREGKAPVLDIGVVRLIREGAVRVFPGVERIEGSMVCFADGRSAEFDAIVAAVGYERSDAEILEAGREGDGGLHFCGFWISPTGQIREIARDARKIASAIRKQK